MKDIFGAIMKILVFILLLPLIISCFLSFQTQILTLPVNKEVWVLWGAWIYLLLKLFFYDFKGTYDFGKSLVEKLFVFFKPAGYIIPVYSILLIICYIIALVFNHASLEHYFLFAISFSLAMHLILTAHEMYETDGSVLKAHYLLTFGAVFVINIFIMSLLLAWAIPEFSFVAFVKSLVPHTVHIYNTVYRTLFID